MNTNQPASRTRTGKIARLPEHIRAQLNQRLRDGQPGSKILPWLNALPEVRQVLAELFANKPISDRNLTSWRQGGFRDDTHQHAQTQRLKELSTFAIELGQDTHNPSPVGRRCSAALTSQPHSASLGPTSHSASRHCSDTPTSPNPTHFIQGALTLVTAQIFDLLQTANTPDLNQLIALIKALTRIRSTEIARQNADTRREQIQQRDAHHPQTPDVTPQPRQPANNRPEIPTPEPLTLPPLHPKLTLTPTGGNEDILRLFTAMDPNLRQLTETILGGA